MLYIIYNHNINVIYTCICNSLDTYIMSWTFALTYAHTPLHSECGVSDVKLYTFSCCSCSPSFHAHPVKRGYHLSIIPLVSPWSLPTAEESHSPALPSDSDLN